MPSFPYLTDSIKRSVCVGGRGKGASRPMKMRRLLFDVALVGLQERPTKISPTAIWVIIGQSETSTCNGFDFWKGYIALDDCV